MAVYEYYCRVCHTKFEKLQPISAAGETAECPSGHPGAVRTISLVAAMGRGSEEEASWTGGCACGGACTCGAR